MSYADLYDFGAAMKSFSSMAGYTSPRVLTWQRGRRIAAHLRRVGDRQLLLDSGVASRARTLFPAGRGQCSRRPRRRRYELRDMANAIRGRGRHLGKPVRVNNVVLTVIGVAPPKLHRNECNLRPRSVDPGRDVGAVAPAGDAGCFQRP